MPPPQILTRLMLEFLQRCNSASYLAESRFSIMSGTQAPPVNWILRPLTENSRRKNLPGTSSAFVLTVRIPKTKEVSSVHMPPVSYLSRIRYKLGLPYPLGHHKRGCLKRS